MFRSGDVVSKTVWEGATPSLRASFSGSKYWVTVMDSGLLSRSNIQCKSLPADILRAERIVGYLHTWSECRKATLRTSVNRRNLHAKPCP